MANILGNDRQQQILALGRLGWPLRRIEQATGVRRETASAYLKAAGIAIRAPRRRRPPPKPASQVSTDPANPASEVSTDPGTLPPGLAALPAWPPPTSRAPTASSCEPYRELIEGALGRGRNAMAIWQDLVDQHGFPARYASVRRFVAASTQNFGYRSRPRKSEVTVTNPSQEATVTRASLREYAAVQRERYQQASRPDKRRLLDEIVAVTGLHRKAAIRLLRRAPRAPTAPSRAGRPRQYGPEVAAAAEVLWQASGRIGAHRLHPFVPELLDRLVQCGELHLSPSLDKLVRQASRPTLARLLAPARARYPRRGATTTRPSTWLKQQIPIRTFTEWDDVTPGYCEVDLVAHCGTSTLGFFLFTLCAVDVATSWVELQPLWGKGQHRVTAAVHELRQRWPVPLRGLDSDNGSEFINQTLYGYCTREGITFTRSRAWKKNDSAHVEQKNGAVVRHLVGYDRFATRRAYAQLARVYALARLHVNFFQPVEKLVTKQRSGARVHRVFDRPQTPYQRLCAAGVLTAAKRDELEALYQRLNPLQLRRDLETALEHLWTLAAPDPHRAANHTQVATPLPTSSPGGSGAGASVTLTSELTRTGG